jgi:hypothetical protein
MGSRKIVLVSTAGFSVLNTGIFWREAKTKRLFSQCGCHMIHLRGPTLRIGGGGGAGGRGLAKKNKSYRRQFKSLKFLSSS